VLGLPVGAAAQSGEDVLRLGQRSPGATARTAGMAGASVGGVADWGAAVANPAALALVRASHVTASGDLVSVESASEFGGRVDSRANQMGLGHAAYVARMRTMRGSFVLGVGYHRATALDRRLVFNATAGPEAGLGGDLYERGFVGELNGVAAVEVAPGVYLGGSAALLVGDYTFTESLFDGPDLIGSTDLRSDLRGFNARAGLVAEAAPGLRLGIALETPTWLYAEEAFARDGAQRQFSNYTLQTPWRVAAGATYVLDRFLLSADVGVADWAQARLRPTSTFTAENDVIQRTYREAIDLRAGGEYDFGLGAVRAGYAFKPDPLRDGVEVDRARHTVAAGLSFYARPGVTLDFAVSYTEFRDQLFPFAEVPPVREEVGVARVLLGAQFNL